MRLLRLDRAQVDDSTGKVFDDFQKERGKVPNMFRTMAQRPELMRTAAAHMRARFYIKRARSPAASNVFS